jgi:DNA repair protein RecN (Recombination protein N)
MLAALSIRDIVLIDRLDLEFGAGMTAFTGETGAGKSILLDAFALALGARGDPRLIRAGAPYGQVTAQFDLNPAHPVFALLAASGVEASGELILRRVQAPDGRAKAFINETPVSVQTLRRAGETLVEIHGQHEDRAFVDAATHRRLVDMFGGHGAEAARIEALWRDWREAEQALAAQRAECEAALRNADYARHAAAELEALDPLEDEEDDLARTRTLMQQSGKVAEALEDIAIVLADSGFDNKLAGALRRLERQPCGAELGAGIAAAVERVLIEIAEASAQVKTARRVCEFSPADLEAAETRLFALREMARKHRCAVADLPALVERFRAECAAIDAAGANLTALESACATHEKAYREAAAALSSKRRAAAKRLDAAVARELKPLKLERARFIEVRETDGGPAGFDAIHFAVQTNPGSAPGPMMKVASGGELARFILALKVALAEKGTAPTLVFDEIDQGVGGATASAIGERLAALGRNAQVLAVTHSPQVASHANAHFSISKHVAGANGQEAMITRADRLAADERVEEIARMLAGRTITEEARRAAQSLIGAGHG